MLLWNPLTLWAREHPHYSCPQTLADHVTGSTGSRGLVADQACLLQMKLPQIQKIMMEFEKQSEIMDMKEEMMNDAIDDAMGDEDDEEERYILFQSDDSK